MKLQKVLVVLGISTCLLAAEMQGTFGMEEDIPQEGGGLTEDDQEEAPAEQEMQPEQQLEAPAEPETAAEVPETQPVPESVTETPEIPADIEMPEGGWESQDTSAPDGGEQTGNSGNADDKSEENDSDMEDGSDGGNGMDQGESLEGETGSDEGDGSEEGNGADKGGSVDDGSEEEAGTDQGDPSGNEDGSSNAGGLPENSFSGAGSMVPAYQETETVVLPGHSAEKMAGRQAEYADLIGTFKPSSEFIDNREKIKYNVEMPIEGLPEFITTEMIVGALKCQDETGYPASVTIAQIIQESGFGKYGPEGERGQGLSYLAFQYNNLFGIKGRGPAGTVDMGTGEQSPDGTMYHITAVFRVYHTYTECIEDRAELLEEVYSDLTEGVKDANTFAMRIGRRWATSLTYGQNLIQQMRKYDLYRLDRMTLDEFSDMLGTFVNPCPGSVLTSSFGYRTAPMAGASTYHKGIDMGTGAYHIPTYAAQEGTVVYAGEGGAEGIYIVIAHENGLVTKYMHHDKIYVETGDEVEKGQQIGLSGSTGNSTGNHLHFQVEQDGQAVDPLLYLNIQ